MTTTKSGLAIPWHGGIGMNQSISDYFADVYPSQLFSAQGPVTSKRKAAELPVDEESDIAKIKKARKERLRAEREVREHEETQRQQRQHQRKEAAGLHHDQWEDEGPNNSNIRGNGGGDDEGDEGRN